MLGVYYVECKFKDTEDLNCERYALYVTNSLDEAQDRLQNVLNNNSKYAKGTIEFTKTINMECLEILKSVLKKKLDYLLNHAA